MMPFKKILISLMLISTGALFFISCVGKKSANDGLSNADRVTIANTIKKYQDAWLKNDSTTILSLFTDTATLIPSGMDPIHGRKAITEFWWPPDSSKTTIDSYSVDVLEINGNNKWAYAVETGQLEWSYEKREAKFSRKQKSYEITIFNKTEGQWKITRRIWTDQALK